MIYVLANAVLFSLTLYARPKRDKDCTLNNLTIKTLYWSINLCLPKLIIKLISTFKLLMEIKKKK